MPATKVGLHIFVGNKRRLAQQRVTQLVLHIFDRTEPVVESFAQDCDRNGNADA